MRQLLQKIVPAASLACFVLAGLLGLDLAVSGAAPQPELPAIELGELAARPANPFHSAGPVAIPRSAAPALAAAMPAKNDPRIAILDDPLNPATAEEIAACRADIELALSLIPGEFTAGLESIRLHFAEQPSRGLATAHSLAIDCHSMAGNERVAVAVHELGHVVDLSGLVGSGAETEFRDGQLPVLAGDPSADFYRLSWLTESQSRVSQSRRDFFSGYAMTNSFEDFAESFSSFVLQGRAFRELARESAVLAAKYEFIRTQIFSGQEFETGSAEPRPGQRAWDSTLLPFDLAELAALAG